MDFLSHFLVFYLLPRPLARAYVACLTFIGMLIKKQLVGPRNIQISIPAGCDHNCQFCITDIHGVGSPKRRETLSFDEVCALVDSALSLCSLNLNFVSTGEPALYPKLIELIEYVWKKSRGRANIKIVTNGTSLPKFSPALLAEKNVFLWLSLHSGDQRNWESIHRPLRMADEKFSKLKTWLVEFNKMAPGRVTLHNVVSKLNMDHLDSILKFAQETHSRSVFFGRLYGFPHLQLDGRQEVEVLRELEGLASKFQEAGIKNNIRSFKFVAFSQIEAQPEDATDKVGVELLPSTDFYRHHNCYISWLFSTVDDTGKILSCGGGRTLGSTREKNYAEVFNSTSKEFIAETTSIKIRGTNVTGCRCQECPHIQMNAEANHYIKRVNIKRWWT